MGLPPKLLSPAPTAGSGLTETLEGLHRRPEMPPDVQHTRV